MLLSISEIMRCKKMILGKEYMHWLILSLLLRSSFSFFEERKK
jgi:hypothetical protein